MFFDHAEYLFDAGLAADVIDVVPAMVTTRKAWASMARMVQRCQEVQRCTWCSSGPASFVRFGRIPPPSSATRSPARSRAGPPVS